MNNISSVVSANPLATAAAATALAATAYYTLRSIPDKPLPSLNVWSLLLESSSTPFTRRLFTAINEFPSQIFRLTCSPFLNVVVLKGSQGTKAFHGSRELDLGLGFDWLLGDLQPKEGKDDLNIIELFLPNLKPKAVEVRVAKCMVPTMGAWIKKMEAEAGGTGEGEIPDLISAMYKLIVNMALRSFVGYSNGDNEARIEKLIALMGEADIENLIRENPMHLLTPWWPSLKQRRDQTYKALQAVVKDIVDDYWLAHPDVPLMDEDLKKEYEDHDLLESAIRKGTTCVDGKMVTNIPAVFNLIYSALFAAASNQFVISALYLYFLSSNPTDKALVLAEIQPLVTYLRSNSFTTSPTAPTPPHLTVPAIPFSLSDGFPRLESGVFETMRVSIKGLAPRVAIQDMEFEGHVIKKGTAVLFPHESVGGNEEYHVDAEVFKGGRFVMESGGVINPHSNGGKFLGFGYGRHPCLGMRFATGQIKVIVSIILATWDIEFPDPLGELPLQLVGVLRPEKPLRMKWKRRVDAL
ncbi:hypothetical protein HDV00_002292 [Rhizophlyctis rosea]|nr:hypothetical protein HDV00_002292 [Rhizophlyctis rosea]